MPFAIEEFLRAYSPVTMAREKCDGAAAYVPERQWARWFPIGRAQNLPAGYFKIRKAGQAAAAYDRQQRHASFIA